MSKFSKTKNNSIHEIQHSIQSKDFDLDGPIYISTSGSGSFTINTNMGGNIILSAGGQSYDYTDLIDWSYAVREIGDEKLLEIAVERYKNNNKKIELIEKLIEVLKD